MQMHQPALASSKSSPRRGIAMMMAPPAAASPLPRRSTASPALVSRKVSQSDSTAMVRQQSDSSTGSSHSAASSIPTKISVSVRLKPVVDAQQQQQQQSPLWSATANSLTSPDVGSFTFDHVFDDSATSRDVYEQASRRVISSVLDGYHGTIFAYGMTGTGKTYTMQGVPSSPGLIPLAIADIFDKAGYGSVISVSYLEIYNERVRDLLNPSTPSDALKLQEQADLVRVRGLRCVRVDSAPELLELIAKGDSARKTEGTEYNAVSSRSHAVLQIFFERAENNATSVLSLCDLAGSERAASDAERRKEGAYINRSLLALGTIISRLSSASSSQLPTSDGSSSSTHIPYRDSKLTRLLQHSLSGQALVSVICTIDPHATSKQSTGETLNTLRFAARAKNITITPARALSATNAATSMATTALIESLRLDLERERAETEIVKVELADVRKEAYERAIREREMWEREKRELELQRDALKDKVGQLTRMILASSSDKRSASASARSVSGSTAAPASESTSRTTRKSLAPTAAVASGGNEKEGGDRGEDEIQIFLPKQRV